MTVDEAIAKIESDMYDPEYDIHHTTRNAIEMVLEDYNRIKQLLNDRLPNGGMVCHEAKNPMKPTLKHDTQ